MVQQLSSEQGIIGSSPIRCLIYDLLVVLRVFIMDAVRKQQNNSLVPISSMACLLCSPIPVPRARYAVVLLTHNKGMECKTTKQPMAGEALELNIKNVKTFNVKNYIFVIINKKRTTITNLIILLK